VLTPDKLLLADRPVAAAPPPFGSRTFFLLPIQY
jgi:hypothetical protein